MNCGKCGGNCESCGGCGALELGKGEIAVLTELGSVPFWPIARKADSMEPVCPEMEIPELTLILMCLEKKGLIDLNWDLPLKGFDYGKMPGYPVRGSMALTLRGQQVLDILEIQGLGE